MQHDVSVLHMRFSDWFYVQKCTFSCGDAIGLKFIFKLKKVDLASSTFIAPSTPIYSS